MLNLLPIALRRPVIRQARGPFRVWWHPSFRLPFAGLESSTGHDPRRAESVLTWLLDTGIITEGDVTEAQGAPWEWIAANHDADYLATLDRPEVLARIVGLDPARIPTQHALESWRRATGGVVAAARWSVHTQGRSAVLLGGFHHAGPRHGAGFCAINDVAVAVRRLRADGFQGSILILDVDAHPPDGTVACLADVAGVTHATLGVAAGWEAPAGVLSVVLDVGTGDDRYLRGLDALLRKISRYNLAFVLAGADPLDGDRFGAMRCSLDALIERDRRIDAALGVTPSVWVPAGGYTAGAWRVFAQAVATAAGFKTSIAHGYDPVARKSEAIARALDPAQLGLPDPDESFDDVARELHLPVPGEQRLLGFYTAQGAEYALTRFGILPELARMGFDDLRVTLQCESEPERLRILCDLPGLRDVLLAELAISIKAVSGLRTLYVDWLSLRDPRGSFSPDRPRLPGQEQPGLGLAEEFGHLLVRMAEHIGLAGVSFIPAHYHVAWMVRQRFRFVEPAARGRFAALATHLDGVPLVLASTRLDAPGLLTEYGDVIRWEPSLMLAPLTPDAAGLLRADRETERRARRDTADRLLSTPTLA